MEPNTSDERLEGVSTSVPYGNDPSLPPPPPGQPPPPQSPSIPASRHRPRNRAFIPAAMLVVVLPVYVWDLQGQRVIDESWMGERRQAVKPPDWLVELPDFVGLPLAIGLMAALGWLILEYWLQSWGRWWFIILGTLCVTGILAALTGREVTATEPIHDFPGFGWLTVFAYLCAYVPLSILLGTSLYRSDFKFVVRSFLKLKRIVKRFKYTILAIAGILVVFGITGVVVEAIDSGNTIAEIFALLLLAPLVMGAIGAVFALIVLLPFAIALVVIWFVPFRTADWVRKRRVYW